MTCGPGCNGGRIRVDVRALAGAWAGPAVQFVWCVNAAVWRSGDVGSSVGVVLWAAGVHVGLGAVVSSASRCLPDLLREPSVSASWLAP